MWNVNGVGKQYAKYTERCDKIENVITELEGVLDGKLTIDFLVAVSGAT